MKIVLLAGKSESTLFLYNELKKRFSIEHVLIEERVSNIKLIRSRVKKFGYIKVFNQLLFQTFIVFVLKLFSKTRINEIKDIYALVGNSIPQDVLLNIESVNSNECLTYLKKNNPDLILVNGTRIISKNILNNIPCLFINSHVGITPEYRGVHGAYWALVNKDGENCGVTVHKVDEGIDTGDLIKQKKVNITGKDNFVTYPYLQIASAIELLKETIENFQKGELDFYKKETVKSNLYTHPTFTEYIYNYITKCVK
jgi:folate-dependent phosphoribosylglycinamide formyltransferase PurN